MVNHWYLVGHGNYDQWRAEGETGDKASHASRQGTTMKAYASDAIRQRIDREMSVDESIGTGKQGGAHGRAPVSSQ